MTSTAVASALWFFAVLALIPLALWLLKRTSFGTGGGAAARGMLRSVAVLSLSPSHRIVTLEVGSGEERRWLVLGVTPQSISTLHSMAPQSLPAAPQTPLPSFTQLLAQFRKSGGPSS
ncbi:MAG: flagellar biosynthetic protein FliO [Burkholderiales bacterium]|jgi:flagellar protein FliO/FliZ|nr:flagellar biosynthetic protein FliO [Burkholderiales bacterium]